MFDDNIYCNKCLNLDPIKQADAIEHYKNLVRMCIDGMEATEKVTEHTAEALRSDCQDCYVKRCEEAEKAHKSMDSFETLGIANPFKKIS